LAQGITLNTSPGFHSGAPFDRSDALCLLLLPLGVGGGAAWAVTIPTDTKSSTKPIATKPGQAFHGKLRQDRFMQPYFMQKGVKQGLYIS